ncbi:hypothetical protein [Streptomyces sp. NPDC058486]|uniref:hypothetical protein n=1 Tax=unclassified Streptomyces TaxID=2593676 RepID=UPI0036568938
MPHRPARTRLARSGPEDVAWWVLTWDTKTLHQQYASGQWAPNAADLSLAGTLVRLQWSEASIQAVQRTAPTCRLSLLLCNLAFVLRHTPAHDRALLPVHHLVDALADHQHTPATAPVTPAGPDDVPGHGTAPGQDISARERGGHRKPQQASAEAAGPGSTRGGDGSLDLGGLLTSPLARHCKPRADDPAPEGVNSLGQQRWNGTTDPRT